MHNIPENFVSVNDQGLLYGYGLFETLRLYKGMPFLLENHLDRLLDSARKLSFLRIPERHILERAVYDYVKRNRLRSQGVRLSISYGMEGGEEENTGPRLFLTHRDIPYSRPDYERGIRAALSSFRKNEYSAITGHKTFNQLENVLPLRQMQDPGLGECIFLNTSGFVAEGSRSNIFWSRDNRVFTPSLDCGVLPGITRERVIELLEQQGVQVEEGKYPLSALLDCDECFCTNSLMEMVSIVKLDDRTLGKGQPGPVSRLVHSGYRHLVEAYCPEAVPGKRLKGG